MRIAIPKEIERHEKRVAVTPETVKKMAGAGFEIHVETLAGESSLIADRDYESAGAVIEHHPSSLLNDADLILKVQKPSLDEITTLKRGACLISLLQPKAHHETVEALAKQHITSFALDLMPRIARAQKMDALSSQSNIAGYKAVLMASNVLKKMMPLMMTAAGTVQPARVLILGAGVAGLQAIATAKRLGAVVEAYDTRPVVKEQVESLGAKFLSIEIGERDTEDSKGYAKSLSEESHRKEMDRIRDFVKNADIVITTAQIPGKQAPLLISEEAVKMMRPGSVIVDLAVETGGNCALSKSGEDIRTANGVMILGSVNVPSLVPFHASQLYARNMMNFLFEISKGGNIQLNLEDELTRSTLVTHEGEIRQT